MERKLDNNLSGHALRLGYEKPNMNGPQREAFARQILNDAEYLRYRGMRVASRITVPLTSTPHIKNAAVAFRHLAKELDAIFRDGKRSDVDKVFFAQHVCTSVGQRLKMEASPDGMGQRDGSYKGVR
tara:strand:+ start:1135 stop:1515 length:381 start_codon:yes stop_codon:yes gene_type:complete